MTTNAAQKRRRRLHGNAMMRTMMRKMETSLQVPAAGEGGGAAGRTTTGKDGNSSPSTSRGTDAGDGQAYPTTTGKPRMTRTTNHETRTSTSAVEVAPSSTNFRGATAANEVPRANFSSPRCALYSVGPKIPTDGFLTFFPKRLGILLQILHAYYTFISVLSSSNYERIVCHPPLVPSLLHGHGP